MSKRCDYTVCCVCFQADHQTKSCPFTARFLRQSCRRCGQRGHSDQICPDLWRQYKYTTDGSGAPILAKFSSQSKSSVYCANCATVGHFTEQCRRSRMNSRFVGPPPIMEVVRFDEVGVYDRARLSYRAGGDGGHGEGVGGGEEAVEAVEMPSFIGEMDVTAMVDGQGNGGALEQRVVADESQFGCSVIMLSPIKRATPATKPRVQRQTAAATSSTPRANPPLFDPLLPKVPTKLPGITTDLLKKLFPEETSDLDKLPPALRKKLRKKLKNLM